MGIYLSTKEKEKIHNFPPTLPFPKRKTWLKSSYRALSDCSIAYQNKRDGETTDRKNKKAVKINDFSVGISGTRSVPGTEYAG